MESLCSCVWRLLGGVNSCTPPLSCETMRLGLPTKSIKEREGAGRLPHRCCSQFLESPTWRPSSGESRWREVARLPRWCDLDVPAWQRNSHGTHTSTSTTERLECRNRGRIAFDGIDALTRLARLVKPEAIVWCSGANILDDQQSVPILGRPSISAQLQFVGNWNTILRSRRRSSSTISWSTTSQTCWLLSPLWRPGSIQTIGLTFVVS